MRTYDLLNQTSIWIDKHGTAHKLEEMDTDYRDNVLNFLHRNAAHYEFYYSLQEVWFIDIFLSEDNAADLTHHLMQEQDKRASNPQRWIRQTPLYHALYRLNHPANYSLFLHYHPEERKSRTIEFVGSHVKEKARKETARGRHERR